MRSPEEEAATPPGGDVYGAEYYRCCCGELPYERRPEWLSFFASIAENVVSALRPQKVLDAGCAMGFLVEAFWDRGVEAWGVDLSAYALSQVRRDLVPYCRRASLVEPIDGWFDLVTCIEVLEHLPEDDCRRAAANLTRITDRILFSSTPSDLGEATHCNVRPLLAWLQFFAGFGFHPDLTHDAGYVAPHAMLLRRGPPVSAADQIGFAGVLMAAGAARQQADRLAKLGRRLAAAREAGGVGDWSELEPLRQEAEASRPRRRALDGLLLGRAAAMEREVVALTAEVGRLERQAGDFRQAAERQSVELVRAAAQRVELEGQLQQSLVEARRAEETARDALLELQRVRERLRARPAAGEPRHWPLAGNPGIAEAPAAPAFRSPPARAALPGAATGWRRLTRGRGAASLSRLLLAAGRGLRLLPSALVSQARRIAAHVDEPFYFRRFPEASLSGLSAAEHYLRVGARQGLDPSPAFDTRFYLARHPDVVAAGINPLVHYLECGAAEGRETKASDPPGRWPAADALPSQLAHEARRIEPSVDAAFYHRSYPEAKASGLSAAEHYLRIGARQGFNPSPAFDTLFYLARYPDVDAAGLNPLLHYVDCGAAEGRDTHPDLASVRRAAAAPRAAGGGDGRWSSAAVERPTGRLALCAHERPVTVIVAVHDAREHVRACLSSIVKHTLPPYELLLVDDGSQAETAEYLRRFAAGQGARLIRNATARGYTAAANQALQAARGEYVVLLNSDTVVSADWLDRLVMCADSDARIGLVGPLSNTASWQSVPEVEREGDWAPNPLPAGWTAGDMARAVAAFAGRTYPRMSFLNGFCLLVKRAVIDAIGTFDEAAFGEGYGEENDYCLRARAAGWELALADDVYVHHAQGQSYTRARRLQLCENASRALHAKHDPALILQGVRQCRDDLALVGIRARAAQLVPRRVLIERGRQLWEGRRVAFALPILEVGGGANVVLAEARAMRRFGVDVLIVNLEAQRAAFLASYTNLDLHVAFAPAAADVADLVRDYDAVVATAYHSVFWLAPLRQAGRSPRLGYYVQDFEPLFFAPGMAEYRSALSSYTVVPEIVLFTKTAWNRDELRREVGVEAAVVGASCDIDLFRPGPAAADGRLRLCAMIRPSSARRGPRETMELLAEVDRRYGERVDIHLFGVEPWDPLFQLLPRGFRWQLHGVLAPEAMAGLLATQDMFVDLSRYQALGLTAMEAMASGLGVVVPRTGGASSFAADGRNALVVDTANREACLAAVVSLIEDPELLSRLRSAATRDIVEHFPERAAFRVLSALFGGGPPCRP